MDGPRLLFYGWLGLSSSVSLSWPKVEIRFFCWFLNLNFFSNYNCSNVLNLGNLQKQVKKALFQKLFLPFTVQINCFCDLKHFANSRPSDSKFKSFSLSLGHFFSHSQNNFGNKIPVATTWKLFFVIDSIRVTSVSAQWDVHS